MVGGPQTDRRGNELLGGGFIATYQQPPTDVRGSLTVTNGPLLTAGTVTVS